MADIDISSLRKSFEQIRDERKTHANTATRIGNAFLSLLGLVSTGAADCLSSEDDDIANGVITFLKGLKIGQNGDNYYINSDGAAQLSTLVLTGLLELAKGLKFDGDILSTLYNNASESGFGLTNDGNGNYSMFLKNITIWGKAIFNELEIRKLSYVGGNFVFSPAGSKIINVETYTDKTTGEKFYRCYFEQDDGTTATTNMWKVDDQARCQTFNIKSGVYDGVSNRYYWRRVIAVGDDYIDLSDSDHDLSADNDTPAKGDMLVCEGNRTDTDRQSIIVISTTGDGAPAIQMYSGINTYNLGTYEEDGVTYTNRSAIISPSTVEFLTKVFRIADWQGVAHQVAIYKGDWSATEQYGFYDQVTYNGKTYVGIYPYSPYPAGAEPGVMGEDGIVYWQVMTEATAARVYDAFLSDYADNLSIDADGNCVGGLWDDFNGTVQYRVHSAVFARCNGDYLLLQNDDEDTKAGYYKIHAVGEGCTAIVVDGTVYITAIDYVRDGVSGTSDDFWTDEQWETMRNIKQCSVRITVDCEGQQETVIEMPVALHHLESSVVSGDFDNDHATISWSDVILGYIGTAQTYARFWHGNERLGYTAVANGKTYEELQSVSLSYNDTLFHAQADIVEDPDDSSIKCVELTIEPLLPSANSIKDGDYTILLSATLKKQGIAYEKTLSFLLTKDSRGVTFELKPTAAAIVANYEAGALVPSPSTIKCSIVATTSEGQRTLDASEWTGLGLAVTVNGKTYSEEEISVDTDLDVYEFALSGNAVDNEAVYINKQSDDIISTVTEYVASASGTVVPGDTESWQATPPSVNAGEYLWTRITRTYRSGKTDKSYSVSYQGESAFTYGLSPSSLMFSCDSNGSVVLSPNTAKIFAKYGDEDATVSNVVVKTTSCSAYNSSGVIHITAIDTEATEVQYYESGAVKTKTLNVPATSAEVVGTCRLTAPDKVHYLDVELHLPISVDVQYYYHEAMESSKGAWEQYIALDGDVVHTATYTKDAEEISANFTKVNGSIDDHSASIASLQATVDRFSSTYASASDMNQAVTNISTLQSYVDILNSWKSNNEAIYNDTATYISQNKSTINLVTAQFNSDGSLKNTSGLVTGDGSFATLFVNNIASNDLATNAGVSTKLEGYYTKAETEAEITAKVDGITISYKTNYDDGSGEVKTFKESVIDVLEDRISLKITDAKKYADNVSKQAYDDSYNDATGHSDQHSEDLVDNQKSELSTTGIDIENHKITLTGDNLICKNNDGEDTLKLDSEGNLTISGTIKAGSSNIGGLEIGDGSSTDYSESASCIDKRGLTVVNNENKYGATYGAYLRSDGIKGRSTGYVGVGMLHISSYCSSVSDSTPPLVSLYTDSVRQRAIESRGVISSVAFESAAVGHMPIPMIAAYGKVTGAATTAATTISGTCASGSMTVNRESKGKYTITIPFAPSAVECNEYYIIPIGYGTIIGGSNPIKATVVSKTTGSGYMEFVIETADDESVNDGSFEFLVLCWYH